MTNIFNAVSLFGMTLDLDADYVLTGILISQILLAIINIFAVAIVLTRISVSKAVQKNAAFTPRKSVIETKDGTDVLLTATAPQNVKAEELVWFVDGKKTEASGFTYLFHATEGNHEVTVAAGETTVFETLVFVSASSDKAAPAKKPAVAEKPVPIAKPVPVVVPAPIEEPAPAAEPVPVVVPAPMEEPAPEEVPVPATVPNLPPRYDFSFTAKLIRSGDEVKSWYGAIKNELLSYYKVKDRMSWKKETFKSGRVKTLARISFRGKTLCVVLPLDAAEFAESKYKLEAIAGDTPSALYRIKNERRAKYCKDLIAIAAERLELARTEREPLDYYLKNESISQLLAEGLAKQIAGEPVPVAVPAPAEAVEEAAPAAEPVEEAATIEETVEEAAPAEEREEVAATAEPVEEVAPIEETVEEAAPASEPAEEPADGVAPVPAEEEDNSPHYDLSFTARLIRADDEVKGWYGALKNELLSYNKVRERISWRRETFKRGNNVLARFAFRGKTLCVFLPLDAAEFAESKYKLEAVAGDVTYSIYRIRNERRAKYCKELIAIAAERLELARIEREPVNYYLPKKSVEQLLSEGLAKQTEPVHFGAPVNENEKSSD